MTDVIILCELCEKQALHMDNKIKYYPHCSDYDCARRIEYDGAYLIVCIGCVEKLFLMGIRSDCDGIIGLEEFDEQFEIDEQPTIYLKGLKFKDFLKNMISHLFRKLKYVY